MMSNFELRKKRDFSAKLSASIDFLRINAKQLFKSCVVIAGPILLIGAFITGESYGNFFNYASLVESSDLPPAELMKSLVSMFVGLFIAGFGSLLLLTTTYQYIKLFEERNSNQITVSEVWTRVLGSLPRMLGAGAIIFIGLLLVYTLFIVLVIVSGGILAVFGIPLPFFLIYLTIVFTLVFPILTFEDVDVMDSFGRAFKLIKGKWWSTFGILIVTYILVSIINSMFTLLVGGIIAVGSLHDSGDFDSEGFITQFSSINTIISLSITQLLMVFTYLALAFQYFNLSERKDATGLMNKIDSFGQTDPKLDDDEQY